MRKDVLHMLRRVRQVQACLDRLDPDDRLVVEILLDDGDGKVARICDELCVSKTTAYRYIDEILEEISNLLPPF